MTCKTCNGAQSVETGFPGDERKPCPDCHPAMNPPDAVDASAPDRDQIIAWLDRAPLDWPFTGSDIAGFIRAGMPEWETGDNYKPGDVNFSGKIFVQRPGYAGWESDGLHWVTEAQADVAAQFGWVIIATADHKPGMACIERTPH